jgi:hypothetical protein
MDIIFFRNVMACFYHIEHKEQGEESTVNFYSLAFQGNIYVNLKIPQRWYCGALRSAILLFSEKNEFYDNRSKN